jgi:OOP family OmpA-OmpF porin
MNLLNLIQSQLSPQAVGQISNAMGESPEGTRSALSTAIPALLGSLVGKATASPSGATEVFNLIKEGPGQGTGWSDSITDAAGNLSGRAAQPASPSLLSSLLGSKLGPVTDFISSRCGIRGTSATSLLGMAAPLILGTLGKHITTQGLGPTGLGQLLGSQTQYLKGALPAGLAETLGLGNLLSGTQAIPRAEPAAYAQPSDPAYARPVEGERAPARTSGILRWALVAVAVVLGGWFVAHLGNRRANEMGGTRERTEVATGRGERTPIVSTMTPAAGSPADSLAKAISAGDWSKTIDLEGLDFDSSGALTDSGKGKIQEIGTVLSKAPNVKIQITAYGESDEAGQIRAESIKNTLASTGASPDRISTRGQTGTGRPAINLMQ